MAGRADDRNLMVELTGEGTLVPSVNAAGQLRQIGGSLWRLIPQVGRLMLLERVGAPGEQDEPQKHVLLCGTFQSANDLHNAIGMLSMAQQDGALHVTNGDVHKVFYFRQGDLMSARSDLPEDRLGNVLVRVGLLSAEDRDKCLPDIRAGQPFGTVLVNKGIMTKAELYEGLKRQAEEIFYSILPWEQGAYYLVGPLDEKEVPSQLHLRTQGLLMDGVRVLDEESKKPSAGGDTQGIRRIEPLPLSALPKNGPLLVVDCYNQALVALQSKLGEATGESVRESVAGFLAGSLPFRELFSKVRVHPNGALDAATIAGNIGGFPDESEVRNLQLGLSEILFFALFAAGEEVTEEVQREIENEVASALEQLPHLEEEAEVIDEFDAISEWDEAAVDAVSQVILDSVLTDDGGMLDSLQSLRDLDAIDDGRMSDSIVAAIVDEEFTGPQFKSNADSSSESAMSAIDDGFDFGLDQDEEIISLLDQVTQLTEDPDDDPTRTPSKEFEALLVDDDDRHAKGS